jgi:hypothetical protein
VVKFYGRDEESMKAYHRELAPYTALESLQGEVVPELLADRYILCGVRYLAVSASDGVTFSSLWPNITDNQQAAALAALDRVYAAAPGFLHGDLDLRNVMLLQGSEEGDGDVSSSCRVVILDFGESSIAPHPVPEQQRRERMAFQRALARGCP